MTDEETQKAERLLARLQEDDLQSKLKAGFERDFANSLVDQWTRSKRLSARQLEVLADLVGRHDGSQQARGSSRRYEGFGR